MSRSDPQFKLRMPPHLKDVLEQKAKDNGRSMNAELLYRLEKSLEAEAAATAAVAGDPHQQINALTEQMGQLLKAIAAANLMAAVEAGKVEVEDSENEG